MSGCPRPTVTLRLLPNYPLWDQGGALRAPLAGPACRSAYGGPASRPPGDLPTRPTVWDAGWVSVPSTIAGIVLRRLAGVKGASHRLRDGLRPPLTPASHRRG